MASKEKKMRKIGRWYIGETLGKGGYSWVKKGFDIKTGKCVSLQFMAKADEHWTEEQSKPVTNTLEAWKQIRHPNVVKLYAYNLNAQYPTKTNEKIDTVLLVLEYTPYGEIFDICHYSSALPPKLARTYFRQCIFGLEAGHNAGIAHYDIKLENLLIGSHFDVKLRNFALSKIFESDVDAIMNTTSVGTDPYRAPELLLNKPYSYECDIFSMGVILFILITGYQPFEQAHYSDRWFRPLAKGDYTKLWKYHNGCSITNDAKCKDLLQRMLCYDPKQRITISEIKKHPWFNDKYLMGKDLIYALRNNHREIEAKRRRDVRKIKDLPIIRLRYRGFYCITVPEWNEDLPEEMGSNTYVHYKEPQDLFHLLYVLIVDNYGEHGHYDSDNATMTYTISKKDKSVSQPNTDATVKDYEFEVSLFKSKRYDVIPLSVQWQGNVYIVTFKKLQGDSYKFNNLKTKILRDGVSIFNGLPEWALKDDHDPNDRAFDKMVEDFDLNLFALHGFLRECQELLPYENNTFYVIPSSVFSICLQYYGWNEQDDYDNIVNTEMIEWEQEN